MASQSRRKAKSVAVTPQECSKGVKAKLVMPLPSNIIIMDLSLQNPIVQFNTLTALSAFLGCCI